MRPMLLELLTGIIDYAGLFPPARLPMAESVSKYLGYEKSPDAWILNHFLCPAARLSELADELAKHGNPEFGVGVIGTVGKDYDAFQDGLEADAKAMTAFQNAAESTLIEGYESRLPSDTEASKAAACLRAFDSVDVFLELPWGEAQSDQLAELAEQEWIGAKARTGGLEAAAFPSSLELAAFLKGCQDLDLPFKLTAGLHHAVPTWDEEIGARNHGFTSVLAALAMNAANDLSTSEVAEFLNSDKVEWLDQGVHALGFEASANICEEVRELFRGFGSCSVDEPIADLKSAGFLKGATA